MVALSVGPPGRRRVLRARIRLLTAATITWNLIEAAVALIAGAAASSAALTGFGLDSLAEIVSAAAVAWQFTAKSEAVRQAREKVALRIVAGSFFVLAVYVAVHAMIGLASGEAGHSTSGVVLAGASLVVMPLLSAAQRRAGRELGSASAVADSKQALLCTYLAAALLAGLFANLALGWWWADPVAALAIAAVAAREGREAWRGRTCCPGCP
ncbi:cation transporter [Catenulispora sp. MAP5-51]|uniref:cation transporter n=1 Tax=Catenulispora sp. MAP5-51 TaxID=3156298 RepID=UPI00351257D8